MDNIDYSGKASLRWCLDFYLDTAISCRTVDFYGSSEKNSIIWFTDMWKRLFIHFVFLFLFVLNTLFAADYSIVFVHIGKQLPAYIEVALVQARAFNPDCPIILVANESALKNYPPKYPETNVTFVTCESLKRTEAHTLFSQRSGLNAQWGNGFWLYTSERFLYLNDLIAQYNLKNIFHLENDNMLYVNLGDLLPIFESKYQGLGITMDNDHRCIPGFVYISNPDIMSSLAKFFADHASESNNDMVVLERFRNACGADKVDNLPIIMKEYVDTQPMISPSGHVAKNKYQYCQNIYLFDSIFDAAAIGQYLGGTSPLNGEVLSGFINESCVFNPSLLKYEWVIDEEGRRVPFVIYGNNKVRINSLHIHSKNLTEFASRAY